MMVKYKEENHCNMAQGRVKRLGHQVEMAEITAAVSRSLQTGWPYFKVTCFSLNPAVALAMDPLLVTV